MSVISSLVPPGPVDFASREVLSDMYSRGLAGGAVMLLPALRLLGLALLISSGIALIRGRRRWGYSTIVKDPTAAFGIGALMIAVACWSVLTDGIWRSQARRAADASTRIASGTTKGRSTIPIVSDRPAGERTGRRTESLTPALTSSELAPDRPFPANGTFERTVPLRGKIARMSFANGSGNNAIVTWLYNLNDGSGDKEALRLYLAAGQSATIDIPAFDYRLTIHEAPPSLGLDRGFGPDARPRDLGLIDLKTPAIALSRQPAGRYSGYGMFLFQPGIYSARR